jgi:RNA polymerase sigma-70 factor (ECF subfamily)
MDYKAMALKLNSTETAARVAVHRLRKRYRHLIRAEVARTVASPLEIQTEIRHLFQALSNG